jgi:hypothetical protein
VNLEKSNIGNVPTLFGALHYYINIMSMFLFVFSGAPVDVHSPSHGRWPPIATGLAETLTSQRQIRRTISNPKQERL